MDPNRTGRARPARACRRALAAALALAAVPALCAAPAVAAPTLERVSVAAGGGDGDGYMGFGAVTVSDDGRFAAFSSQSANLVDGDATGPEDVFVRDRASGTTERVSVASDGTPGDGPSDHAVISRDGRWVIFRSDAANLVADDTNGLPDLFLHDRRTRVTERVSVGAGGQQGDGMTGLTVEHGVSDDGRWVAFASTSANLVPADREPDLDLFVRDRVAGTTLLVTAGPGGEDRTMDEHAAMSGDGRFLAFTSGDRRLAPEKTTDFWDVYRTDRETGETRRVSVATDGAEADQHVYYPSISADGRRIAFESRASTLVAGDTNEAFDAFVHDAETGVTQRVSLAADGAQGNSDSGGPHLGGDGRWVVFGSSASNLVGDGAAGAFRRDLQTGAIERITVTPAGAPSDGRPDAVSADGRHVGLLSYAPDLVPGDGNELNDAFVADFPAPPPPSDRWADALAPRPSARVASPGASLGAPDGRSATLSGALNQSATWLFDEPAKGDLTLHLTGQSGGIAPTVQFLDGDGRVRASHTAATFLSGGRRRVVVPCRTAAPYRRVRILTGLVTRVQIDALEAKEMGR